MKDMSIPRTDIGTLIAQRLCHDLVNPLGAIGNGLDLLSMTQPETPETQLMRDSLEQALGRIKLYRLGFGPSSAEHAMAGTELAAILATLGKSRPIELQTDLPDSLSRAEARILLLMGLCAETALAWGGTMLVQAAGGQLAVTARASRLRIDTGIWEALGRGLPPEAPTPPLVHFALLAGAARSAGRRLGVEQSAEVSAERGTEQGAEQGSGADTPMVRITA